MPKMLKLNTFTVPALPVRSAFRVGLMASRHRVLRRFWRRMHPKKPGEGRPVRSLPKPEKGTRKKALPEPVLTVEAGPNTRPARPAIISLRLHPEKPTYCNDRCRSYVRKKYKPDGGWYRVAGPVDYCAGCSMAIEPDSALCQ